MPMIDVYATEGTFSDKHALAQDLAKAVMRWEQVPEIPLFLDNTAAFVHDLPAEAISNGAGESNYVRVQVLTPINVLDSSFAQLSHLCGSGERTLAQASVRVCSLSGYRCSSLRCTGWDLCADLV